MIALLLIRPGPLRDGLDALLVSIPEVHLVAHSSNSMTAIDFCRKNETDLIVIEIRSGDREVLIVVPKMKALCPRGHVLALIHSENDRLPAEQAKADLIMSVGAPASKLKAGIEELARASA